MVMRPKRRPPVTVAGPVSISLQQRFEQQDLIQGTKIVTIQAFSIGINSKLAQLWKKH